MAVRKACDTAAWWDAMSAVLKADLWAVCLVALTDARKGASMGAQRAFEKAAKTVAKWVAMLAV